MSLTEAEQAERRAWFRWHWENGVAFNRTCRLSVRRWEPDGIELHLPYDDMLGAHAGIFHGGVIAALIDTCGVGAVFAGHDFAKGSNSATLSLAVTYLGSAPGEDVIAYGRATKRGGRVHFAEVKVRSADTDTPIADGLVTATISGERAGLLDSLARFRSP